MVVSHKIGPLTIVLLTQDYKPRRNDITSLSLQLLPDYLSVHKQKPPPHTLTVKISHLPTSTQRILLFILLTTYLSAGALALPSTNSILTYDMLLSILLITSLSAGALALPTTNPISTHLTNHTLTKRGTHGWISSYANDDPTCSNGYDASYRPKVRLACLKFTPISDNIGINWGTWPWNFNGMNFYSDDACKHQVWTMDGPQTHDRDGPQTCVNMKNHGGPWGSVQGTGVYWD